MRLSRAILSGLLLVIMICLYQILFLNQLFWSWYMVPFVLAGVLVFIFSPQIDFWWYSKKTQHFDPVEFDFIQKHNPYFANLSPQDQDLFAHKTKLFVTKKEFILQEIPSLPDDIKLLMGSQAVMLAEFCDLDENQIFDHFERIVIYPHPFLTPKIDQVHSSETHFPDGVWIYSLEQMLPGLLQQDTFINIVAYEMARVIINAQVLDLSFLDYDKAQLLEYYNKLYNIPFEEAEKWVNVTPLEIRALILMRLPLVQNQE